MFWHVIRCVFCYELEPTFQEVAENVKPHDIKFGKVDIEEEKPLKQRFSVTQLPDVRIFRKGIMYKYAGPLGASGSEGIVVDSAVYCGNNHAMIN